MARVIPRERSTVEWEPKPKTAATLQRQADKAASHLVEGGEIAEHEREAWADGWQAGYAAGVLDRKE